MTATETSLAINRCFLCDRSGDPVVWRENGVDGRRCASCGTVYSDYGAGTPPRLDLATELHPDGFYAGSSRLKARWMAARCARGRVLEVGCGEASFLDEARRLGFDIAAMEPHPGRAAHVAAALGIPVEQAFIEDDTMAPGQFDVVYHCDLLVHFPDPLRALRSMTRLLKPDGVLCFEVGTLGGISTLWYKLCREVDLGPHLYLYSPRALELLWQQAGLEVVHQTEFCLGPDVLVKSPTQVFAKHVVRRLFSARHEEQFLMHASATMRYRVGRIAPRFGPSTFLFVVKPAHRDG